MHDVNGTPLAKGDSIMIPAVITSIYSNKDYCNVTVKTVNRRWPDDIPETITLNTGTVILLSKAPVESPPV